MTFDSTKPASTNRREFLQAVAAGTAGAAAMQIAPCTSAKDETVTDPLPIIDTHQHLWDLKKFTLPWHAAEDVPALRRSFVMSDYLEATKGLNVVKTVYMEVDVAPEQQVAEADYVTDLCQRGDNPMKAAVVSGRPGTPGFEPYVRKLPRTSSSRGFAKSCTARPHRPATACNRSLSKASNCWASWG